MSRSVLLRFAGETDYDLAPRSPGGYVDTYKATEAEIQSAVLEALRRHPRVAWAHRFNAAAGQLLYRDGSSSRFMRFGFPGMADIMGQMRAGQFLAVEVKRAGKNPTAEQQAFLEAVRGAKGVAFVARSVDDVFREIPP